MDTIEYLDQDYKIFANIFLKNARTLNESVKKTTLRAITLGKEASITIDAYIDLVRKQDLDKIVLPSLESANQIFRAEKSAAIEKIKTTIEAINSLDIPLDDKIKQLTTIVNDYKDIENKRDKVASAAAAASADVGSLRVNKDPYIYIYIVHINEALDMLKKRKQQNLAKKEKKVAKRLETARHADAEAARQAEADAEAARQADAEAARQAEAEAEAARQAEAEAARQAEAEAEAEAARQAEVARQEELRNLIIAIQNPIRIYPNGPFNRDKLLIYKIEGADNILIENISDILINRKIYTDKTYNIPDVIMVFKYNIIKILTHILNNLDYHFYPNKFNIKVQIGDDSKNIIIFLFCNKIHDLGHLSLFLPNQMYAQGSVHYTMHKYGNRRNDDTDLSVFNILLNKISDEEPLIVFISREFGNQYDITQVLNQIQAKIMKNRRYKHMIVQGYDIPYTITIIKMFIEIFFNTIREEIININQHSQFGGLYHNSWFHHCY